MKKNNKSSSIRPETLATAEQRIRAIREALDEAKAYASARKSEAYEMYRAEKICADEELRANKIAADEAIRRERRSERNIIGEAWSAAWQSNPFSVFMRKLNDGPLPWDNTDEEQPAKGKKQAPPFTPHTHGTDHEDSNELKAVKAKLRRAERRIEALVAAEAEAVAKWQQALKDSEKAKKASDAIIADLSARLSKLESKAVPAKKKQPAKVAIVPSKRRAAPNPDGSKKSVK